MVVEQEGNGNQIHEVDGWVGWESNQGLDATNWGLDATNVTYKRWHREGRSSSKQDTASPSGGGKEHERPGDSVNERNDTEQTWSQRKAGPSISIKAPT